MKKIWGAVWFCFISWSAEAQDPGRYDVVLHELFADPSPVRGLPASEFVEIRNRSSLPVNLKNWTIRSGSSTGKITSNSVLMPDSIAILCGTAAAPAFQAFGNTIVVTNFPALDNDGDTLTLSNGAGQVIHALVWNKNWYGNEWKEEGGWSLEMKDIRNPCSGVVNWTASTDNNGGTPGRLNASQQQIEDSATTKITYAYLQGGDSLFIRFSAPVSISSGLTITTTPGLTIARIVERPPLFHSLLVILTKEITGNEEYRLSVTGLSLCKRIQLPDQHARFGLLHPPKKGDIIINELLFDPPSGGYDYLEIYNRSSNIVDVAEIRVANRNSDGRIASIMPISSQALPLYPGQFLAISENPLWVRARYFPPDSSALLKASLPSLPDDKGTAILLDAQGAILDEVAYLDDWHLPLLSNKEGVALERIDAFGASNQAGNWHTASGTTGFGTPGYRNGQTMRQPSADRTFRLSHKLITPDNDGRDDFLLLWYSFTMPGSVANISLFDESGRPVAKLANNLICGLNGQVRWDGNLSNGIPARSGFYILYAEAYRTDGTVDRFRESVALYRK